MKVLLDDVSVDSAGSPETSESGMQTVIGKASVFVSAAVWDGATVTIWGRGIGAEKFIVMGENSARTEDGPVTIDIAGPWNLKAVVTNSGASTEGINAYVNQ